jgi:hypothetical protein
MSDASVGPHLSSNHRDTLRRILGHPVSGNIEWQAARSLLAQVGEVTERHDGKFEVTAGGERLILEKPHGKDLVEGQVVDLRNLLRRALAGTPALDEDAGIG